MCRWIQLPPAQEVSVRVRSATTDQLHYAANLGVVAATDDPGLISRHISMALRERSAHERHDRFAKARTDVVRASGVRVGSIVRWLESQQRFAVVVELITKGDGMPRASVVYLNPGTRSGTMVRSLTKNEDGVETTTFTCVSDSPRGHVHIRVAALQVPANERVGFCAMVIDQATVINTEYGKFVACDDIPALVDRWNSSDKGKVKRNRRLGTKLHPDIAPLPSVRKQKVKQAKEPKPPRQPSAAQKKRAAAIEKKRVKEERLEKERTRTRQLLVEKVERDRLRRLEKAKEDERIANEKRRIKREKELATRRALTEST